MAEEAPAPPMTVLAERFQLEKKLGQGGMGQVWQGFDTVLRRKVAVKLLPPAGDAGLELRFQREAAILAALRHPGITVVHDAGEHGGYRFIVMELLEGSDLSHAVTAHPHGLPIDQVLDLAAQAGAALAAAHREGVIHRDLKPANLFLQTDGSLKICDFGIARAQDATSALTATGLVIGTLPYMSPEQCLGRDTNAASDLYSLGCVLFELLTGRPPFASDQPPYMLMQQHVEVPAPRVGAHRAQVPAALDALVATMLAKRPQERPSSAETLVEALAALRDGVRTPARGPAQTAGEPAESTVERAVRIARGIPDDEAVAEAKAEALMGLATACAESAPDHGYRLVSDMPGQYHVFGLLYLADAMPDGIRARQLLTEAEALLTDGRITDPELQAEARLYLASLLVQDDAERAVGILDDTDACNVYHLTDLAAAAARLAATEPVQASQVARTVERLVRRAPLDTDYPEFTPSKVAEIATVCRDADADVFARLADHAESLVAEIEAGDRETALEYLAPELVVADPSRARRMIEGLVEESDRDNAWGMAIKETGTHHPERVAALLDICCPPDKTEPRKPETQMGWLKRLFATLDTPLNPSTESSLPWHKQCIAVAAAPYEPHRSAEIVSRLPSRWRCDAYVKMAAAVAKTDPNQAQRWFDAALDDLTDGKASSSSWMSVAMGAGRISRQALRAVAARLARVNEDPLRSMTGWALARTSAEIAPVAPNVAERLVVLAEEQSAKEDKDNDSAIARAWAGISAALVRSQPKQAKQAARHAGELMADLDTAEDMPDLDDVLDALMATGQVDAAKRVTKWMIKPLHGRHRDEALAELAPQFAVADPDHAEELARRIVDEPLRYQALASVVCELAETLKPKQS